MKTMGTDAKNITNTINCNDSGQAIFSGADYGFRWTSDGWYEYDGEAAEKAARSARDAFAKELKAMGHKPRKFSMGNQLRSFGGIGSGRPHVEILTRAYGVNW